MVGALPVIRRPAAARGAALGLVLAQAGGVFLPTLAHAPAPRSLFSVAVYGSQVAYSADVDQFNTRWWSGGQQLTDYTNQMKMLRSGYHFLPSFNTGYTMRRQGYTVVPPTTDRAADPHSAIDVACELNLENMRRDASIVHAVVGDGGYYDVGNEVDDFYSDDVKPDVFVGQFDAWLGAIRGVDGRAKIVAPSIDSWSSSSNRTANPWGTAGEWFKSFVMAYKRRHEGRKPPIDVLSMHLYNFDYHTAVQSVEVADRYLSEVQKFRSAADALGYRGVPIWITELGFRYRPDEAALTPEERGQMTRVLAQLAQHAAALRLQRMFYFTGGAAGARQSLMPLYDPNARSDPKGKMPLTDAGRVLRAVAGRRGVSARK